MAVENNPLRIDPYTSTVPLVQLPTDGPPPAAAPDRGNFTRKGTGALAIGDQILKGFMQGHAIKEQKKYQQATATIQAADKSTSDAYQQYQDTLANGKDPVAAQAAYKNYADTFNRAKEAKAKYVIPEKPAKGQKKDSKDKSQGGGFGGGIKDFLAANPHIVPQIALLTMQPKPPGMSAEGKQAQQESQRQQQLLDVGNVELENAKTTQGAKATVAKYASLTPEQIEALPPEEKRDLAGAKAILTPQTASTKYKVLVDPQGQQHSVPASADIPEGWKMYEKPTATGQAKPGSPAFYAEQYAKENGVDVKDLTTKDLDYLKAKQAWDTQQASSSTNTTLRPDPVTGQMVPVTITNSRNKGKAPQPPDGRREFGTQAAPQGGPLTAPPAAPSKKTPPASARMSAPPQSGNVRIGAPTTLKSAQMATNTQKVETEKKDRYQKSQDKFDKAMAANKKNVTDPKELEKANGAALAELEQEHKAIEGWYTQQVHAVGGTTKGDDAPPPGATIAYKDKQGNIQGWAVNGQYVPKGK